MAAYRLEHVAIAHPDLGIGRADRKHPFIETQGLLIVADPAEGGGLEISVGWAVRFGGEQKIKLGQRLFGASLAVQNRRQIGPCGQKLGGQF